MGNLFSDPRQNGEFNKNRENGRKPPLDSQNTAKRKQQPSNEGNQQIKKNESVVNLNKAVTPDSGPGKPPKPSMQQKANMEPRMQQKSNVEPRMQQKSNVEPRMQQKVDNNAIAKRSPVAQQDVRKNLFALQIYL